MPPKLRVPCERCGLEAVFERAGRFRDEDFIEVFHELMEAQAKVRGYARETLRLVKVVQAIENGIAWREAELALRLAELKAAGVEPLNTDPALVPEIADEEAAEDPFGF